MERTVRARVWNGLLEPLEHLDLAECKEVVVTITGGTAATDQVAFRAAAGKWKGTHDPDTIIAAIYADRRQHTRSEPHPSLEYPVDTDLGEGGADSWR